MPQTKLTSDQAFELAQHFHRLAVAVADYRFSNWNNLTPAKRRDLEDGEWSLANYSSDFNRLSVFLLLTAPETVQAVNNITQATTQMQQAINHLATVKKILNIVTAAVTLGGAIISGNPGAILTAISGAVEAATAE